MTAPPPLVELRVRSPRAAADAVAAHLWATGAQGIEERDLPDAPGDVLQVVWVADPFDVAAFERTLRAQVPAVQVHAALAPNTWGVAQVTPLGRAFAVGPPGAAPPPARQLIALTPGVGFGHDGQHPTTALAFAALEAALDHPAADPTARTLLDVGTGAGLLGLLGAARGLTVHAVDIDSTARATARANAALNGWPLQVSAAWPTAPVDLVVANIRADVLLGLLPRLMTTVAPNGRLILAGYRAPHQPTLDAHTPGWARGARTELDGWICETLRRP